jgi:hypothetical protein
MSRDEILKMSMEAGFAGWKCDEEKIERFFAKAYEAGAAAEREAIHDEWSTRVQGDLEHGVKWMNEVAAENWHGSYRGMSGFSEWLTQRGEK